MNKIFSIDYRSLRLFRFGLGVVAVADICLRLTNFTAMHTEAGLIPSKVVTHSLSLFWLSHSPLWSGLLLALIAGAGVLLILDFHSRPVSLLLFVLFLSLRNRNPYITYGGDDLLRLGLLWSSLLPRGPSRAGETTFCTAASVGALGQLWLVYFCAGLAKTAHDWLSSPNATFVVLNSDTYAKPIARLITPHLTLLKWSAIGVFVTERFGWLLFFSPWRHAEARLAGFAIFAVMHLMFGLFLHLELFPLMDIVFLTLLLPEKFWNWLKVNDPLKIRPWPSYEQWIHQTAAILFVTLVYVNISSVPGVEHRPIPPVRRITGMLGIYQAWNMFSMDYTMTDGFYRVVGHAADGRWIDEINQVVLDSIPMKPVDPQALQGGFRWTRYFENLGASADESLNGAMIQYFCKRWTPDMEGAADREISLFHYSEITLAPVLPVIGQIRTLFRGPCKPQAKSKSVARP